MKFHFSYYLYTDSIPLVFYKCLQKIMDLISSTSKNTKDVLKALITWISPSDISFRLEVAKKTTISDWKLFHSITEVEIIVDLLMSWMYGKTAGLLKKERVKILMVNAKLNEKLVNAISYPDSHSVTERKNLVDTIKFSFNASEFQILACVANFFVFIYRVPEDFDKETFNESLLVIASALIGNKNAKQMSDNIFETEFTTRIIKLLILVKSLDDDSQDGSGYSAVSAASNLKQWHSLEIKTRINLASPLIEDKLIDINKIARTKRNSDSTIRSLLKIMEPYKVNSVIKSSGIRSKFGSNVTDFLSILSEKSNSLGISEVGLKLDTEKRKIPLSKFELVEESNEQTEDIPRIELISKKSTLTFGMKETITRRDLPTKVRKEILLNLSSDDLKKNKTEQKAIKKDPSVVFEHEAENSFEEDFKDFH